MRRPDGPAIRDESVTTIDPAPTAVPNRVDTREVGYDLARCFAIFGMIIVNYRFVMGGWVGEPAWLEDLMNVFTLRAAATFVMLAGVGMTLMARAKAANEPLGFGWMDRLRVLALVLFVSTAWLLVDFYVAESAADRSVSFGPLAQQDFGQAAASTDVAPWTERFADHVRAIGQGELSTWLKIGIGVASLLLVGLMVLGKRIRTARGVLARRVLFLGAVGYAWYPMWGGDILHYYAFFLTGGILVLTLPAVWMMGALVAVMGAAFWLQFEETGGPGREAFGDNYEQWTLAWAADGVFLGGFHPVLPWLAFVMVGVLIGRMNVQSWGQKVGLLGLGVTLAVTGYSCYGSIEDRLRGDAKLDRVPHAEGYELTLAEPEPARPRRRGPRAAEAGFGGGRGPQPVELAFADDFDVTANVEFVDGAEKLRTLLSGRGAFGERKLRVETVERNGVSREAVVLSLSYGEGKSAPPNHERQLERFFDGVDRWVRTARRERLLAEAETDTEDGMVESVEAVEAAGQSAEGQPADADGSAESSGESEPEELASWRRAWPESVGLFAVERHMLASRAGGEPEVVHWDTHWVDAAAMASPSAGYRWADLLDPFSMRPGPGYMMTATGVSMSVIALSLILASFGLMRRVLRPFVLTGQMALSIYVAHVLVGFTVLNLIGKLNGEGLPFIAFYVVVAWVAATGFACWWRAHWKRGPLESVMRWLTA